ncbi:MAG: flagellar motor switch phosphatase FliY [Bacillota bacterium]
MGNFLSQEEIDALLMQGTFNNDNTDNPDVETVDELLDIEKDALGEIGNISMGSAATALSEILQHKVIITTPRITITTAKHLLESFKVPYLLVDVNFTQGLHGSNILIIKIPDAAVIADLMMGGDGNNPDEELSDIHISAVAEAMNQMIGSAATSMATIFGTSVKIAPPLVNVVYLQQDEVFYPRDLNEPIVIISFDLTVGNLIDSELIQVIPLDVAKREAKMLLDQDKLLGKPIESKPTKTEETDEKDPPKTQSLGRTGHTDKPAHKNLDLILDVPLKVSVILGKSKRPIKEVLNLIPGSIVDLDKYANEPVDILVNGKLIAKGEVVVINENFGVRVTNIVSPEQRLDNLRKN